MKKNSVAVFRALERLYLVWVVVKQLGRIFGDELGRIFGDVWITVWRTGGPGMDIGGLEVWEGLGPGFGSPDGLFGGGELLGVLWMAVESPC